jgi:uncharacterized protein (TIGR03067 family)
MRIARRWVPAIALVFAAGAADEKKEDPADKERAKLAGAWVLESRTLGGRKFPATGDAEVRLTFDGNKVTLKAGGEVVQAGTFEVDPGGKPKTIDIKITEGDGKGATVQGIYELDGDKLKICGVRGGPRPTKFDSPEGSKAVLTELKRDKKK